MIHINAFIVFLLLGKRNRTRVKIALIQPIDIIIIRLDKLIPGMADISCLWIAYCSHIGDFFHGSFIDFKCHICLVVCIIRKWTRRVHGMSCMNIQNAVTFQHSYTAGWKSFIGVYCWNTASTENIPIVIVLYNTHHFFFIRLLVIILLIYYVAGIFSPEISSGCPNPFGKLPWRNKVKICIIGFKKYALIVKERDAKKCTVFIFFEKVIAWMCVPSFSPCLFAVVIARHGLGFFPSCRTVDIRVIRFSSVIACVFGLCCRICCGIGSRTACYGNRESK